MLEFDWIELQLIVVNLQLSHGDLLRSRAAESQSISIVKEHTLALLVLDSKNRSVNFVLLEVVLLFAFEDQSRARACS